MRPVEILREPQVTVYSVDLRDGGEDEAPECLSHDELSRAARFVQDTDARRYRNAHRALRRLLAMVCGGHPGDLAFEPGPWGKPTLAGEQAWRFNLSRREDRALVALSPCIEVGVDIERVGTVADARAVAQQIMSPSELAAWRGVPVERQHRALATCFSRKEAVLKALGCGLSLDPATVEVGLAEVPHEATVTAHGQARRVQWRSIGLGPDWAAAVATLDAGEAACR